METHVAYDFKYVETKKHLYKTIGHKHPQTIYSAGQLLSDTRTAVAVRRRTVRVTQSALYTLPCVQQFPPRPQAAETQLAEEQAVGWPVRTQISDGGLQSPAKLGSAGHEKQSKTLHNMQPVRAASGVNSEARSCAPAKHSKGKNTCKKCAPQAQAQAGQKHSWIGTKGLGVSSCRNLLAQRASLKARAPVRVNAVVAQLLPGVGVEGVVGIELGQNNATTPLWRSNGGPTKPELADRT